MKVIYPEYYKDFKCTAQNCNHNCCIGWEIDIDEKSLELYKSIEGDLGKRLEKNISLDDTPHFILKENDRCPFLNSQNLCDIYSNLGEECLCQICSDHPRFYNEFENTIEAGLGLCCEEAARLIITNKKPFSLTGKPENTEINALREKVFAVITDRENTIPHRIEKGFELLGSKPIHFDIVKWAELFENLERLDENWSRLLLLLKEPKSKNAFDNFMKNRQTEYEQFLCYLVYRHFSKAEFYEDALIYWAFAALAFELVFSLGAEVYRKKGGFTEADQLEVMRLFSAEIEYSDENLDIIFSEIEKLI